MFPFINPYRQVLQRYIWQFLKDRYNTHERTVDRISSLIVSEKDAQEILALFYDLYQSGYIRSVNDMQEQLKAAGITANLTQGNKNGISDKTNQ